MGRGSSELFVYFFVFFLFWVLLCLIEVVGRVMVEMTAHIFSFKRIIIKREFYISIVDVLDIPFDIKNII